MAMRPGGKPERGPAFLDGIRDLRRRRWMYGVLRRVLSAPDHEAFGAFGRSVIVPPARISLPECIFIGDGVVIHEGVWLSIVRAHPGIEPRLEIRDGTKIGRFCQVSCVGEIVIEEEVLISDQVQIGDTYHEYENPDLPSTKQGLAPPRPVRIGRGALLNLGVVVLPGTTIGASAYVEEGSIVTRDVPPGATVAGNPARIVTDAPKNSRTSTLR
jgi:acetyltransferase-like isoleucine patch superfamily enzyme